MGWDVEWRDPTNRGTDGRRKHRQSGRHVTDGHFQIRPATRADLDAVAAIERVAFSDPWSVSDFHECVAAGVPVLVAVDASGVVGYIVARGVADEGEILNLAVGDRYQRRGVGRALVRAALVSLAASGAQTLYLEVRESNDAARRLYEGLGFEILARRKHYYRRPDEAALVLRAAIPADRSDA